MAKQANAAFYREFGGFDNLEIGSLDFKDPGEGEVLVRVKGAGVNPVDAAVMQGYLKDRLPHTFPIIPGWDLSGVVEERGFSARRFNVDDEVYAYARRPFVQWGTFAEYVVIPESYLSRKPSNISHAEAGGIPLVGLTAYQSLYDAGDLQQGQTVLILGASGGVGSLGIQLAKAEGARVIGVASEKNHKYMKELGADEVVDYHDTDVGTAALDIKSDGVDLIFDCAGGETLQQSMKALKDDGKLVSIRNHGEGLDPDINFEYVFVEPNSSELDHLRKLVESGKIEVPVSKTFDLEETAEALRQIQTLHTRGKMVIMP
ncbi:MAG TPA: NADP-dependent oxidoreductase [Balneolaceae bacterium]|nr:NADP-dependent oxidoreductase [Balneolaceae bacterium]